MFNLTDDIDCPWCDGSIIVDNAARLCGHVKPECERWRQMVDAATELPIQRARLLALMLRAQVIDPESAPQIDAVVCDRCNAPRGVPCRPAGANAHELLSTLVGDQSCRGSSRERFLDEVIAVGPNGEGYPMIVAR